MKRREDIEPRDLIVEVERYLAAVDLFRALQCQPTWRPEPAEQIDPNPPIVARAAVELH